MSELEPHYEPEEPQDDDLDAVLSTVAAQGEGEILVKFYKFDKGRGNWIFDAHAVDMPDIMNRIKEEYGGGDYEAVVRRGNRIATRKRFSIMVANKPKEEPRQNNEMMIVIQGMKEMVQGMSQGFSQLGQMIMENKLQATQPQQSPMEMMTQVMTMMTAMQQMMPKPQTIDPMAQMNTILDLAGKLAENMNGGPVEQTPGQLLAKLTSDIAPVLTAALTRPAVAPIPRPAQSAAPQMPKPAAAQPANPQGTDPNMLMKMALQKPIGQLVKLAAGGAAAAECAGPVIEQVPDAYLDKFVSFIMAPDVIEQLISIDPRVGTHREWFTAMVAEMLAQLTEPETGNTVISSETGIEANDQPHYFTINGDT